GVGTAALGRPARGSPAAGLVLFRSRGRGSLAPAFFTPSAIGLGGPFLGIVASTNNSSPAARRVGSLAVSEMKNRLGSVSRSSIPLAVFRRTNERLSQP